MEETTESKRLPPPEEPSLTQTGNLEQVVEDVPSTSGSGAIARGIASVFGPAMENYDMGVEGALKSQSVLASSMEALTRELDKLLEDAPLPFVIQHATKLSGVRKRVASLNATLRILQKRIDNIERMLSGPGSNLERTVLEIQGSIPLCETGSTSFTSSSGSASCIDIPLTETRLFGSSNEHMQDELGSRDLPGDNASSNAIGASKLQPLQVYEGDFSALSINGTDSSIK